MEVVAAKRSELVRVTGATVRDGNLSPTADNCLTSS
jgi:hypothetical protein